MMRVQWFYAVHDKDTSLMHATKVACPVPSAGQEEGADAEGDELEEEGEEEAPDDVVEAGPSKGKGKKAAAANKKPAAKKKKKAAVKIVKEYSMGELQALSCAELALGWWPLALGWWPLAQLVR